MSGVAPPCCRYFPFTEPSFELEIYYNGDWMEARASAPRRPRRPRRPLARSDFPRASAPPPLLRPAARRCSAAASSTPASSPTATCRTGTAGPSGSAGSTDGIGTAATFNTPGGVTTSPDGVFLYVADYWNHKIRQVLPPTNPPSTRQPAPPPFSRRWHSTSSRPFAELIRI